jgi:hypothetical protein
LTPNDRARQHGRVGHLGMKLLKILAIACGAVVAVAVILVVWVVWFAAPPVGVMTVGPAVRIDTRFLGEYYVAASLIELAGSDGEPVLRATSSTSRCTSDLFVFVAGINDVPSLATDSCAVEVPRNSPTFELKGGVGYTFTVVGNNWFGHHRRASRTFTVPGTVGGVSPTNRLNAWRQSPMAVREKKK